MANAWGVSWGNAWGDSWGATVPAPVVIQQPSGGGRRIPNKYEPIDFRRLRWREAKRRLDAERKRLAELKKQQHKVEVQYKAIALSLPEEKAQPVLSDRAHLLEMEIKEFTERVAVQNAKVRALRKEADRARKEAEQQESDAELAMQAHRELEAQSEWERIEVARLQQEADDDEMMPVLLLIHEDDDL
jgi:hypothetical protein